MMRRFENWTWWSVSNCSCAPDPILMPEKSCDSIQIWSEEGWNWFMEISIKSTMRSRAISMLPRARKESLIPPSCDFVRIKGLPPFDPMQSFWHPTKWHNSGIHPQCNSPPPLSRSLLLIFASAVQAVATPPTPELTCQFGGDRLC
jgi:hypothetical protein